MAGGYTPPGVRVSEVPRGAAVAIGTVPLALCLVGIGDKEKQESNEVVLRGQVLQETLTVSGSSPHIATLINSSNQEINQTVLYKDDVALPGQSFVYDLATQITISDLFYEAGAVYKIDYVTLDLLTDELQYDSVASIQAVGSAPGLTDFISGTDFILTGDTVAWQAYVAATLTGAAETYDLSLLDTIKIALDGRGPIEITITGTVQTAVTALEVAADINTALTGSALYGAGYGTVVVGTTGSVVLTCPNTVLTAEGESTSIEFLAPSVKDATVLIFGVPVGTFIQGSVKRPTVGATYYVTYKYDRPADEFNTPIQVFNTDDAFALVGNPSLINQLAIASEIAFLNSAPAIYVVIIEDADEDDVYTDNDYIVGIQGTEGFGGVTEIVALSTRLQVQSYLVDSVTQQSSESVGNRRRAWFGMARGTLVGNTTTVDTFVYRAAVTLQVVNTSPGRGRLILLAPSNVSRTVRLADGTDAWISLDGTYLATAVAALQTSFTSMSQTLLRRTLVGFNADDFQTYLDQEAGILGGGGCLVVRPVGGIPTIIDPLTTEAGGANDPNYSEISARTQADLVATFLEDRLNASLVGAVPSSLSAFTTTAKGLIGALLTALITAGEIGPYEDQNGVPRAIDYSTDVIVTPIVGDRTAFKFRFYFQARFPVKRLFGEFSVGGAVPTSA